MKQLIYFYYNIGISVRAVHGNIKKPKMLTTIDEFVNQTGMYVCIFESFKIDKSPYMQCEKTIIYEFHLHKDIFIISAKQSQFALF